MDSRSSSSSKKLEEEDVVLWKIHLTLTSSPSSPRVEVSIPKDGLSSEELQTKIANATHIPLSSLKLIFRGRLIAKKADGNVIEDYKLEDGCVLHCMGKPDNNTSSTTTAGASVSMANATATAPTATATAGRERMSLSEALEALKGNCVGDVYMTAVSTLEKIVSNITSHPMEEKYRKVKKDNAAFQRRLGSIVGSRDVLLAVGFQEQSLEGGVPHYVLVPSADAWPNLLKAHEQIKAAVTLAKQQQQQSQSPPAAIPNIMPPNFTNNMPPIMPGMESAMQNLMSNPQQLQAMLQNPMVRSMMENDPRFANNPMLRQSLDALLNNPQMMEQMTRMMSDPGMRNQINQMMHMQQQQPPSFGMPPSNNNNNNNNNPPSTTSTGTTNNNTNHQNTPNSSTTNDNEQTEEEMIAEAIARSLREQ